MTFKRLGPAGLSKNCFEAIGVAVSDRVPNCPDCGAGMLYAHARVRCLECGHAQAFPRSWIEPRGVTAHDPGEITVTFGGIELGPFVPGSAIEITPEPTPERVKRFPVDWGVTFGRDISDARIPWSDDAIDPLKDALDRVLKGRFDAPEDKDGGDA